MRRHRHHSDQGLDINMTPLIDMIFILLIFFMVTSSFVRESGVEIERPMAATGTEQTPSIVVGIDASNRVWIDGQTVDIRNVTSWMENFKAENTDTAVVIASDRMARSGLLIEVLDACRSADITNVSVATKNE